MTPIDISRFHTALRRYGHAGRLVGERTASLHLLISDLAPVKHSDLPADGIRAEALALVEAAHGPPREGETIVAGNARWIVRAAVPVETGDKTDDLTDDMTGDDRMYRLQLAAAAPVTP